MSDDDKKRFESVALDFNKQWAYAVVRLRSSGTMARQFCQFVVDNKLGNEDPADNWELWQSE